MKETSLPLRNVPIQAYQFQTTHSCLPVTALQSLRLTHSLFLFSGHGPFLTIINGENRNILSCQRVFTTSHIHGITCDSSPTHAGPNLLLIWGGSSLCFAKLKYEERGPSTLQPYSRQDQNLIVKGLEIGGTTHVSDWILDASFACDASSSEVQASLVTAHNELLLLRFGQSRSSPRPQSNLLRVCPDIIRIPTVQKQLLYSAVVQFFLPSGAHRVVAGTAFGTVLVWSNQRDRPVDDFPNVVELNSGHKGIVFGIDQYEQWLASCSDDRGIRLGMVDVNAILDGAVVVPQPVSGHRSGIKNTAQVSRDGLYTNLGEKWSHNSRAWRVKFFKLSSDAVCLVSVGEDAVCQIQQIKRAGLIQLVHDHYHSGKNIWSLTDCQLRGHQVVTGGADGAVVSRAVPTQILSNSIGTQAVTQSFPRALGSHSDHSLSTFTALFLALDIHPASKSRPKAKPPSIKQYLFVSHSCLLALTDSGYLLTTTYREEASKDDNEIESYERPAGAYRLAASIEWRTVSHGSKFGTRPVLSDSKNHLAFLGNEDGNLFLFSPEDKETVVFVTRLDMSISWLAIAGFGDVSELYSECCVVVFSKASKTAKALWIRILGDVGLTRHLDSSEDGAPHMIGRSQSAASSGGRIDANTYRADLPETFTPTSACLLPNTGALVLGSRQSAIAIYKPLNDTEDVYRSPHCTRHVHGNDTVTSISAISPTTSHLEARKKDFFLTTSRNGTYAVHSVDMEESSAECSQLDENTLAFETLDISTSLFSSSIEGSYCAEELERVTRPSERYPRMNFWSRELEGRGRCKSGDLLLYGFSSEKFVVWNESHRSLVFSVDCANEHRPWAYNVYTPDIPDGQLKLPCHGPFAWTQAGSFNILSIGQPDHFSIQQGGHGREIKALSASPLPFRDLRHGIHSGILIATGAEDTTIRFFAIGPTKEAHACNGMVCVRTEKKHTTGVQHLCFSSCGNYLFSSAGCEELFAWRIRYCVPGVNFGMVLDCNFPKALDKLDLRITDFSVRNQGSGQFVVSAVYSNSMIAVFHYTTSSRTSKSTCKILHRCFYQDNCLTQINDSAPFGTITGSTDGHVAYWSPQTGSRPFRKVIHQSSIKVMHTVTLPMTLEGRLDQLVITGGDDNALGLTLMCTDISQTIIPRFQSLLIPKAHAAAITAICLLPIVPGVDNSNPSSHPPKSHIRFLSTGTDQRVKLWSVTTYLDRIGVSEANVGGEAMAALDVELAASTGTSVADAGAMELVSELETEGDSRRDPATGRHYHEPEPLTPEMEKKVRVLIVGVGMEVLQFKLES